jgi:hypothetical protein
MLQSHFAIKIIGNCEKRTFPGIKPGNVLLLGDDERKLDGVMGVGVTRVGSPDIVTQIDTLRYV